jgi:Leucine-rich repeat (LRR) protein
VLPAELNILTALHLIDFSHNTIQDSIPSQFTELGHMQFFDLRHNKLTGSIPAWIGTSFQNLRELGLSFNQMTGTLPSSMNQMEALKTLALAHNDFESSLAPIMHLPELEYLYLENNRFKDTVNDEFLVDSISLVQLDLSSNLLTGQGLPHHFFAYPNLKVLDLSDNQINGTIQDVHIRKHPLEFLSLSNNSLTGTLPTSIAYLRSLRHLDLTGNNLSGDIPPTLGNIPSLNYLFLSENNWTPGPIPTFLSEMSNLRELGLRATNRTGSLSSQWFEKLQLLELFDISNNEMSGSIPSRLFENSHLHYVLLNRNEFDGELPTENIGSNLQLLLLDKNKVTGNMTGLCIGSNISIATDCVEDEIVCECCHCCADSDVMCDNYVWYMNEEFSWENNYTRTGYAFSPAFLMPKTKGRHSQGIQVNNC